MNKNLVIAALVASVLVGGIMYFTLPREVVERVVQVGAAPGQDFQPDFSFGGVQYNTVRIPVSPTSSTFCILRPPGNATSTVNAASVIVNSNGLGAAQTFDLSTSTVSLNGGNGTSSPALALANSIGTGQTYWEWQPSATTTADRVLGFGAPNTVFTGSSNFIVKPGEALTFKIATNTPSSHTTYLSGYCQVEWKKLGGLTR